LACTFYDGLKADKGHKYNNNIVSQPSVASVVQEAMVASGLSSREINRARRVARLVAKQKSRDTQDEETMPDPKRAKIEVKQEEEDTPAFTDSVPDSTGSWGEVS
jgi:dsRNA-specific ribonuclease